MTSDLRWLLPWPQMVQVHPAKFYPPAAELIMHHGAAALAYTQPDMFCSDCGGGFSLSVIIQELTVTSFSKGPALLPFSSSSTPALRSPCAFFKFFVLGIFFCPLPASVFIAFCSSSLFSSSSISRKLWPPVWLSLIP